jgi:arylformamidase
VTLPSPADWSALSQPARDAAYNNSAAVPESAALLAEWTAASQALRAAHSATLDLPYGLRQRNKWDLFPGDKAAPCLVFIHGGYWQRNSREMFACMAEGVRAHGWSAALPGYTLAPDACLSEIVTELRMALDWFAVTASGYGIGGPVVLAGWSAGGHLAALLLDHPLIAAGLAISGVFDLQPLRTTYLDEKLRLNDVEIETLSPLRLPPIPKPLTLGYGTNELPMLIANSHALHDHRRSAGLTGDIVPLAGHNHFSILDELRKPDGALTTAARDLVAGL